MSKLTPTNPLLDISEAKILAAANQFVTLGLKNAGYQYINVDDCWAEMQRDPTTGQIVPDSTKFPNGISSVAAHVHSLGLLFGIYRYDWYFGSLVPKVFD